ncbi:MAG TPA: hypothetical protein VGK54_07805, partial [Chloroflexota bacterium]
MRNMWYRSLGVIAGLLLLGSLAFVGGEYATYTQAVGMPAPAAASQAMPVAQTAPRGFTAVAKEVTPAVVNITSRAVRSRDRRQRDPMDE